MSVQDVYILSALRTPICSFRSSFANLSPVDLGSQVSKGVIEDAGILPNQIDEIITGAVLTASHGQNISRQIALKAGIPEDRNAYTVNKVCSSSLKALILASQSIQLGCRNSVLVVGVENMSQAPFYLSRGDHGYGDIKLIDSIQRDGISDAILNDAMGVCAEKTAKDYNITRQEQDAYALSSYARVSNAWKNGEYAAEVVPVSVKQKRGADIVIAEDEEYKRLVKEKVPTLPTAFIKDGTGTITAANASSLNDGAAAILAISGQLAKIANLNPIAKIIGYAEAGRAPIDFTVAPVDSAKELLRKCGISKEQIAKWEVNEAFSVTAISFIKELDLDPQNVNARGGAVALGHPIGCSGARIVVTLIHQLKKGEYGVAAICNGGGEATSILVQKC